MPASSDQGDLFAETAPSKEPTKKATKRAAKPRPVASSDALPSEGSLARLPKRISPSRLKDYMQCPKLFYYKTILGIPTPNTIHTTRGTLAHTACELIFDHEQGTRDVESAVAYVRPAWKVLIDPLAERDTVVPDSPEGRIRVAYESYRDLVPAGSKKERQMLASAKDYVEVLEKEAASQGVTVEEALEELMVSTEGMVRGWYGMETPDKFNPTGRELHLQAKTAGTTVHGFIDRLDVVKGPDGSERVFISDYKGLAVDSPLPTPTGWTTMGEVQVGDYLLGSDGRPTRVTVKSDVHTRPCYRVEFDDGSHVVCDNVHLWQVTYGLSNRSVRGGWLKTVVLDADGLAALKETTRYPVWIPNAAPLELPEADLPVDPYVLGVWLGDGANRNGLIYASAAKVEHLVAQLEATGEKVSASPVTGSNGRGMWYVNCDRSMEQTCSRGHHQPTRRRPDGLASDCYRCSLDRSGFPSASRLSSRLRHLGLLYNKHVPAQYLRASVEQRLSLLQGLMDTDGSWNSTRQQAVFVTTTPALADAVVELVHSLGWRSNRFESSYESAKGPRRAIMVMFTPFGLNPFRLPDKASLVRIEGAKKSRRRLVKAVVPVETVPTQCVAVDAHDSLYLAGRSMVPTHNTGKVPGEGKNYRPQVQERIEEESFFAMKVYALLYYELNKVVPDQLRLLYVRKGDQSGVKKKQITPMVVNQTRRQVSALWKQIEDSAKREIWDPKTGPLCNWCYFQDVCPAFNDGIDRMLPEYKALRGEPVVDEVEVMVPPAAALAEDEPFSEATSDDPTPQEHSAVRIEEGREAVTLPEDDDGVVDRERD